MITALLAAVLLAAAPSQPGASEAPKVTITRLGPDRVQPVAATSSDGTLHVVCLSGKAESSDLQYLRRPAGKAEFDPPVRINSTPGSAVAMGAIRGPSMSLGKDGRLHVVWNGSLASASGKDAQANLPLWYSRSDLKGAFEPQRNIITRTRDLDGGGVVAADRFGAVTIAWHADDPAASSHGEAYRRVFVARSTDEGAAFAPEAPVTPEDYGACACCATGAYADPCGRVVMLYRAARAGKARDVVLLRSDCAENIPSALTFVARILDQWPIGACPMTSCSLAEGPAGSTLLAWETKGQVWGSRCAASDGVVSKPFPAPGAGDGRKHPRIVANSRGQLLLVWTERATKDTALAWQVYDDKGAPIAGASGKAEGVPMWSFAAAAAASDGGFEVIY